jgi:hypothetical protein
MRVKTRHRKQLLPKNAVLYAFPSSPVIFSTKKLNTVMQQVQPIAQRQPYRPVGFTRFLWWLATAEEDLLVDCVVDRNRYAITGMAVLGTWLFATLAWAYFFSTVVNNAAVAVMLGIVMGGMVLSIDRALIKGITARNKRKFIPLVFRVLLAVTIGTFMAQPAMLYLFNKEIHVQIALDDEQRLQQQQAAQNGLFASRQAVLQQQKAQTLQRLDERYAEVTAARQAFIAETDGTGGSHKVGLKDIALAKKAAYERLDAAYAQERDAAQPALAAVDAELAGINAQKQTGQASFAGLLNDGFLTRIQALHNLISNNGAAAFRYYLLLTILVLIELMPVIAKTILPDGSYDEKVRVREEMERAVAQANIQKQHALVELYNQTAFEQDADFIKQFFEEARQQRQQKMRKQFDEWAADDHSSFDGYWQRIKRDMLTKQEN